MTSTLTVPDIGWQPSRTQPDEPIEGEPMTPQVPPVPKRNALILIAFLFLIVIGVTPVMAEWTHETVGGMYNWDSGSKLNHTPVSLAVGSDNNPRISYLDENQHLAFAEWNGKKWITTIVDGTTKAGASSLAVGSSDSPGISYYDATKNALKYAKSNGAIWEIQNVEGGEAGSYNALALDSSNYPWISEYDAGSQRLKSSHWTGTGWKIDGVEGGTAGQYTCIALTSAGNPVIGHFDEHAGNGRLKYVYWDGTRWNVDHVVEEGQVGKYASLAIDKNDVLHFSYYDENNKALKYAYGKIGQEFTTSTVDSGDVGMYTSIALDEDNVPHISYWDAGHRSLKYAVVKPGNPWAADGWTIMSVPLSSGSAWFGEAASLAIGPDGIAQIAYMEHTSSGTNLMHGKFYPTTADFTFSPASGPAPLTVSFTDTTTNGTHNTWAWDFGDGSTSTNQNPVHTFSSNGTYKVKLTVRNAPETLSSTRVKTVKVLSPSNVRVFGDPYQLTLTPTHSDYQSLGGASAIRRDGSLETFVGGEALTGNDWVQVTRGAAIKKDGNLVTWTDGVIPSPTYAAAALSSSSSVSSKKYVQVSQYSDWILAIYEDANGVRHLETRGNSAEHPEVFSNVPSGTDWMMVAAGNDHALAVHSDGTLVAWGNNTYGQLNLPTGKTYTDIAAGEDFSIGLTQEPAGTGGYVVAAGKNDFSQVTSVPKGQEAYIHVTAGQSTGAALGHDGRIILWGKTLPGISPSSAETDFTDISLGATWGLAIKEPASEITLTGPFSPGQGTLKSNGATFVLPLGATLEHTDNDVIRIFDKNGVLIGWVNELEAGNVMTPWGESARDTDVIMIPDGTYINSTSATEVTFKKAPANKIDETQDTLLTINYLSPVLTTTSNYNRPDATYCTATAPNWVEWATMSTSSISNLDHFRTSWTIPDAPAETRVGDDPDHGHARFTDSCRTAVSTWNGIENGDALIQVVPAWNWYYKGSSATYLNFDKAWSWAIWGMDKTHELKFLTTPKSLTAGNSFWANYSIISSTDSSTSWSIDSSAADSCLLWSTADLKGNNGKLEVAEEAYLLVTSGTHKSTVWDAKYFPKNTKFTDFKIRDTSATSISPAFTGCLAEEWGKNISTLQTEITANPYAITLHTTS